MSHSSPNTPHSPPETASPFSPLLPPEDMASLAATLQETVLALRALSAHLPHGHTGNIQEAVVPLECARMPHTVEARPGDAGTPRTVNASPEEGGETRRYYLSPATLRQERELLKKYRADDFRGLLAETHVLLVGMIKIMKSVHPDARLRGYVVSSLGCLLEQASVLILRMRNVYGEVRRVESGAAVKPRPRS